MKLEKILIDLAFAILTKRLKAATISVSSSELVETCLLHKLIAEEREIFGALWLDMKLRLIAMEDIAMGTVNQVCVYPREIVKSALRHNASAVIFYHNHPTGEAIPSEHDKLMTTNVKRLLHVIGVNLLDHIIVSGTKTRSLAERGEL